MCDDVIDMILYHLELVDLTNISDTSKRLQKIAKSIFSRKYGHHLICMDGFKRASEINSTYSIFCKIQPFIRIIDAKIWLKLIRNFGQSIKYTRIDCDYGTVWDKGNIPSFYKYVIEYILKYCDESLLMLELQDYPFLPLNKPLLGLQQFTGYSVSNEHSFDAIKYMPNLCSLKLTVFPKTLNKTYIRNMVKFETSLKSSEDIDSFISFLHVNRQIEKLNIMLELSNYNDLIFSSINEILPELKTLKIRMSLDLERKTPEIIPIYRFKTIDTISLHNIADGLYDSFVLNDFKRLSLGCTSNFPWLNLASSMKNLKILKFLSPSCLKKHHQILLPELIQLEFIIFKGSRPPDDDIVLCQIFGSEWKQIQRAESLIFPHKLKFQRIK